MGFVYPAVQPQVSWSSTKLFLDFLSRRDIMLQRSTANSSRRTCWWSRSDERFRCAADFHGQVETAFLVKRWNLFKTRDMARGHKQQVEEMWKHFKGLVGQKRHKVIEHLQGSNMSRICYCLRTCWQSWRKWVSALRQTRRLWTCSWGFLIS